MGKRTTKSVYQTIDEEGTNRLCPGQSCQSTLNPRASKPDRILRFSTDIERTVNGVVRYREDEPSVTNHGHLLRSADGYMTRSLQFLTVSDTESEPKRRYVGAGRCPAGWVAVAHTGDGFDHAAVFSEFGGLWGRYEETADRILVDVPVGLHEGGEDPRPPEPLTRELLGDRAKAVVHAPVREATRKRRHATATRVNERKTGRPLSERAHKLGGYIAEVDSLLGAIPEARAIVAESHPELCFRAFADNPLSHDAHTAAGYAERIRLLAGFDADAPVDLVNASESTGGHAVRVANVVDASVLGLTARPGPGDLRSLPPDPPLDPEGLRMQIRYRAKEPLTR
jgi:predicted RNase H-like nuclease